MEKNISTYEALLPEKKRINLGVFSDTHGSFPPELLDFFSACDVVLHAGDIGALELAEAWEKRVCFKAVYGNIDGAEVRRCYPEILRLHLGGARLLMTHIAGYPGHYNARIKHILSIEKPQIVICGHSHILKIQYDARLGHLHINPGACGPVGWHTRLTAARFVLEDGKPSQMEIWDKPRRKMAS